MRFAIRFLLSVISFVSVAQAANEPSFGPASEWVIPLEIPSAEPERNDQSIQFLLNDFQTRFENGADEYYIEIASLIQNPQGLGALGTLSIGWQPDRQDLIIHKLHLIRDGEITDILANGQEFAILRRENNLEQATLDGVLTAVIQPEGMEVGDILNIAYSYRSQPGEIAFGSEDFYYLQQGLPVRHLRYRQTWPSTVNMRWQASETMGEPRLRETANGTELTFELYNVESPEAPENAPPRFLIPATLQLTDYANWSAVGALFAPYYDDARILDEDSRILPEIERIAASTQDPRARAMAALRLVQDQVRYVALAMGDGGYVPASADQTWRRRYGDCKGKTALLLAILSELGIEGIPALVSSNWGDGLNQRLPQVSLFDHVIVRINIDGQVYWLDGTQMGDRNIETLRYSPFRWALPIRHENSDLEILPPVAPPLPLIETQVTYDASEGFSSNVPTNGRIVMRGALAYLMQLAAGQIGDEQLQEMIQESFAELDENQDISEMSVASDEDTGEFSISFSGSGPMNWPEADDGNNLQFEFDDEVIDWDVSFEREVAEHADIPFNMEFPIYLSTQEIVILPNDGDGFTLSGGDINEIVAGTQISRTIAIEDGRAIAHHSFRRLEYEVAAAQALADAVAIEAINENQAFIVAPANYQMSELELANILNGEANTANEHINRGYHLMLANRHDEALSAFDAAIALEPENVSAHANRGISLVELNRTDEAESSLDSAEALDATHFVVNQGFGILHFSNGDYEDAITAFRESLIADTDNSYSLFALLSSYERNNQLRDALDVIDTIISEEGDSQETYQHRARILLHLGDGIGAMNAIDQMVSLDENEIGPHLIRARLLRRLGKSTEALAAIDQALSIMAAARAASELTDPTLVMSHAQLLTQAGDVSEAVNLLTQALDQDEGNTDLLNQRCWTRLTVNIELMEALADCERAIEIEPENAAILDSLAWVKLRLGRWNEAIVDFDTTLTLAPRLASSLLGRAIAKQRTGDIASSHADLVEARRSSFDIEAEYGEWLGELTWPSDNQP